jgi:ABC-2 type transport system ATP-binding protein
MITAPTLIVQGTPDTLMTLRDAIRNYETLRAAGAPVRMVWFCGGHVGCPTGAGPADAKSQAVRDWLDRWLRGRSGIDTGAPFAWLADDGRWRDAPAWPPAAGRSLRGAVTGRLTLQPGTPSGPLTAGTPAPGGVSVPVPVVSAADVVGAPRLTLRYRGSGRPFRQSHIYAQVVRRLPDGSRSVIGNQVSPIPVQLDGRGRSVTIDLEPIAARVNPGDDISLQLIDASAMFGAQRTSGSMSVAAEVEFPTAASARLVPAGDPAPAG